MNRTEPKLILTPSMRMLLFICATVLCFFLVSIIAYIIMSKAGSSTAAMRILAVVQSVLLFIVPAIAVALMVTRTPARLLEVDNAPGLGSVMLTVLIMVAAIPALNCIIAWNQSWTLPESMHGLEESLRASEETAASSVRLIMGGTSVMDLIMSILIVGVMAGFSEELFFRGGLQRLFTTSGLNHHVAIWIVATVFSLFHFQFFGLVPRILLGAYFGYLLWWSRSIWLPVIAHVFNNVSYVAYDWVITRRDGFAPVETKPSDMKEWVIVVASAVLAAIGILLLKRFLQRRNDIAA